MTDKVVQYLVVKLYDGLTNLDFAEGEIIYCSGDSEDIDDAYFIGKVIPIDDVQYETNPYLHLTIYTDGEDL